MRYNITRTATSATTVILFLLVVGTLTSCIPGAPSSKPARKKMLNLDASGDGWDAFRLAAPGPGASPAKDPYMPLPFTLADTSMVLRGESGNFLLLRAPSAEFDFLLPAAKAYEPMLSSWLSSWPQLGRSGIVIDLSTGNATQRANLQVECPAQHVSLALVLLWDAASADRVNYLTKFIQSLSAIRCEGMQ